MAWVNITVHGTAAHAADVHQEKNTIDRCTANLVPHKAEASADIHLPLGNSASDLIAHIKATLGDLEVTNYETR